LHHERRLDLRDGVLVRTVIWRSPNGQTAEFVFERMVKIDGDGLLVAHVTVTALDFTGDVTIRSTLKSVTDSSSANTEGIHDPRITASMSRPSLVFEGFIAEGDSDGFLQRATRSGHRVAVAMRHAVEYGAGSPVKKNTSKETIEHIFQFSVPLGGKVSLAKFVAYQADRKMAPMEELIARTQQKLSKTVDQNFGEMRRQQAIYLSDFWQKANVEIYGDALAERAVRFNVFQLLQAAGRDGTTSVAAKGQTGEGYEGHYFWDAEIFILPFFIFTLPDIARKMLEYRCACLDGARRVANVMGHPRGALFPWRTIKGEECSAFFPGGSAQYHINADIAYAVRQYIEATGDTSLLLEGAAELLFETARIWLDIGFYNPRRAGKFCINEVTGPDEYTAMVNNNLYTNVMAKAHLHYAASVWKFLVDNHAQALEALYQKIDLSETEVTAWQEAADRMYLPYDETLVIYMQDDSFLDKRVWDFAGTPQSNYPLLLHYHPLTIYRYQVCKQADTILAFFLLASEFSEEAVRRSFDFYERLTVHDSTLSAGIFSVMASELNIMEKAYDYFKKSAMVDLEDLHDNTGHGLHMASIAGSWMSIVHGFAGMRTFGGRLYFRPRQANRCQGYRFRIMYAKRCLEVVHKQGDTTYRLVEGDTLSLYHHDQEVILTTQDSAVTLRV
jgi:alpha,alpha-trehalose phosphorylase